MCLSCSLFCEITCAPTVFIMIRPEFAYDPDPACRRRRQAPHLHPHNFAAVCRVVIASKFVRLSLYLPFAFDVSRSGKSTQHTWECGSCCWSKSCWQQIPHACLATVFNLPWALLWYPAHLNTKARQSFRRLSTKICCYKMRHRELKINFYFNEVVGQKHLKISLDNLNLYFLTLFYKRYLFN